MENPAYWGEAERLIEEAMDEAEEAMAAHVCGWSTPMRIADKLRKAGLLPDTPHVEHNHFTRAFEPKTCEACANTNTGRKMLENAGM
jgi:hypothetical protein